jgi:hypothetical protein
MNERIKELAEQAGMHDFVLEAMGIGEEFEKFAELIVEECIAVVIKVYRDTPVELCGPLLTASEEIAEHFYGVEE